MKLKLVVIALILTQIGFAQNFKFGKVSKEELQQKKHPTDPTVDAAVLYREFKTHFDYNSEDGFFVVKEVFERVKIYTKEGYDKADVFVKIRKGNSGSHESFSGLKAYTYILNGSNKVEKIKLKKDGIFEEDTNKYLSLVKFTMPNLKEGCVIEYRYSIKSPFINNIEAYRFQEKIPVNEVSFDFKAPEYIVYKTHKTGWLNYKIVKDGNERSIEYKYLQKAILNGGGTDKTVTNELSFVENRYQVNLHNIKGVKEEAYSGNLDSYLSSLKFELSYTKFPNSPIKSYATDWGFVSKSIYLSSSFGDELNKSNYYKADIDALLNGVSDETQKMLLIFEFVKAKMNWNNYIGKFVNVGVKRAYKDGVGNVAEINLMLTSMFKYAKLNANPILISTKNNGIPVVATRNGFNYVIAGVEVNNGVYLFDATRKNSQPNMLDTSVMNWQGRLIREDGSSAWVPLLPKNHALNNAMVNASITEALTVKGNAKQRFSGHLALGFREEYINLNLDDVKSLLEENKIETELSNVELKDLKDISKPLSLSYDFESFNLVEEISDKLYFSPMLFIGEKGNPFTLEERNYPVDFGFPKKTRAIINIAIPEDYTVETMPENTSFSFGDNDAVFRYNISKTATKVSLSIEFTINQPLISASDYKNLKGFYQLMVEKQNEKVVLIKN